MLKLLGPDGEERHEDVSKPEEEKLKDQGDRSRLETEGKDFMDPDIQKGASTGRGDTIDDGIVVIRKEGPSGNDGNDDDGSGNGEEEGV